MPGWNREFSTSAPHPFQRGIFAMSPIAPGRHWFVIADAAAVSLAPIARPPRYSAIARRCGSVRSVAFGAIGPVVIATRMASGERLRSASGSARGCPAAAWPCGRLHIVPERASCPGLVHTQGTGLLWRRRAPTRFERASCRSPLTIDVLTFRRPLACRCIQTVPILTNGPSPSAISVRTRKLAGDAMNVVPFNLTFLRLTVSGAACQ